MRSTGLAVGVDDGDLAERDGEGLVARDLADHGGELVALLQRVHELLRSHAVLRGGLHEVLRELVLRDLDVDLLGDRVEQHLRLELLLAGLGDLGAVHVVLETAFALEVVVHLVLDELRRNRDLDLLEQLLDELVARGGALREDATAGRRAP